jgi:hypothetical protein
MTQAVFQRDSRLVVEKLADKILAAAGYKPNGRPKAERSCSLRAISVPVGGKTNPRPWK